LFFFRVKWGKGICFFGPRRPGPPPPPPRPPPQKKNWNPISRPPLFPPPQTHPMGPWGPRHPPRNRVFSLPPPACCWPPRFFFFRPPPGNPLRFFFYSFIRRRLNFPGPALGGAPPPPFLWSHPRSSGPPPRGPLGSPGVGSTPQITFLSLCFSPPLGPGVCPPWKFCPGPRGGKKIRGPHAPAPLWWPPEKTGGLVPPLS